MTRATAAELAELDEGVLRHNGPLVPANYLDPAAMAAWNDFRRNWLKIRHKSERTLNSYGEALAQLAAMLPDGAVLGITQPLVQDYLEHIGATRSAASQLARQRSLSAWFTWAARRDVVAANPVTGISYPDVQDVAPAVLDPDECRRLIRACSPARRGRAVRHHNDLRDRAIMLLWLEAGSPRVAEMAALQVTDIDLGRDECTIINGKGGKRRTFPLSAATADAISDYIRVGRPQRLTGRRTDTGALWLAEKGDMTVSGLTQMLRRRSAEAGLGRVHPHQLRHTAFDLFLQAGGTPADAMALFGWSSEAMLRVYARATAGRRAIVNARRMGQVDKLAA